MNIKLFAFFTIAIINFSAIGNDIKPSTQPGSIKSGSFQLNYTIEGDGLPTLVIGSSIYYPRVFSQNLRNHLRLIFIDHKGFVPNPGSVHTAEYALDVLLEDIDAMRKATGEERVAVIGHSGHGYLALEYAKKYPNNVSHVIIIGMGPDQSDVSKKETEQYWNDSVCPERKAALETSMQHASAELEAHPENRLIILLRRLGAQGWYNYNFDSLHLWKDVTVNMQMFDHVWGKTFKDIDITQGLENFNIPVLLMLGRYDFIVAPPHTWNPLRSKFKDLTMRIFEQSGHTPQYEEPVLFDAELLKWLQV